MTVEVTFSVNSARRVVLGLRRVDVDSSARRERRPDSARSWDWDGDGDVFLSLCFDFAVDSS